MRVALATLGDPTAESTWSGTPRHLIHGLRSIGVEVVPIGIGTHLGRPLRGVERLRGLVSRRVHVYARHPVVVARLDRELRRALRAAGEVDLLLTLGAFPALPAVGGPPVITWIDATFDGLRDYYGEWTGWSERSVRDFRSSERRSLGAARLVLAASDWAADSARRVPGVEPGRVAVVPFGANIDDVAPPPVRTTDEPFRLLSVGARWWHKGMDLAIEAAVQLDRQGVPLHLDIVGCEPPDGTVLPHFVHSHGRLDKRDPRARDRLDHLYRTASVFVLASRSECFGIVFCEAAAYGLPVVAPRTGGIPSAVSDEVTGILTDGDPGALAAGLQRLVDDPALRARMAAAARRRYEDELNWASAGRSVLRALTQLGDRHSELGDA